MAGKLRKIDRRRVLALGVTGAASLGVTGCARAQQPAASAAVGQPPALTAHATEGPYYFDPKKERADITEGHAGVPLEVRLAVVDETGANLRNARVDLWHCNAAGLYSGYAGQGDDGQASTLGQTFLRGYIQTNAEGVAAFRTIYPGWYRGRTTHIHFKVWNGDKAVLTSQFFLPDALSEFLYANLADYRRTQVRDTLNSTDGIALRAGGTVIGNVREEADRYVAALNVVVDRNATAGGERGPGGRLGGSGSRARGPEDAPTRTAPVGGERIKALIPGGDA
ncbi:MAG: intradiol ring-cleavage dioxygenase [Hyphomonadaceae bacterium]|nr:intradiol ring-cleavage dioxygenase [Hyphomonadaceae bacterium]